MKKFTMFSNYLFLLMAAAILGLTACGDDPILNTEIPPSASIFSAETEIDAGDIITLSISGTEGDAAMNLLTITEDGATIDLGRILTATSDVASNPASLLGGNANNFDFTVEIEGPTIPGIYTYAANIGDDNGKTGSSTVDVTVLEEVATPPSIEYMGSSPREVTLGGNVFNISSTTGSSDLSTIAVYEDGNLIDPTRLQFDGEDFDANPYSLVGGDLTGFDMADVLVRFMDPGTFNLRFEVTDANDQTASTEVSVVAGTPLNVTYSEKFFFNLAGPSGFNGSFDLDSGENLPSSSTEAELQDLGNDADGNWRRQVAAEGNANLVAPSSNSPELFNYSSVNSAEALIAAFNTGVNVPTTGTDRIEVGDVFVVENNGAYYIIEFSAITAASNDEDFYTINVKGYQP